jgi:hypothetical protein
LYIDVASALCADSFEPEARHYNFCGGAGAGLLRQAQIGQIFEGISFCRGITCIYRSNKAPAKKKEIK